MISTGSFNYIAHHAPTASPNARNLYVYSSLCAPVIMGDQTTDLLRQIPYEERIQGNHYFEPRHIHYIPLRNNHFDVIETQLSESTNNNLAVLPGKASAY